jgi:beta-lactamase regulating signal transducer with metallopeptidase domain
MATEVLLALIRANIAASAAILLVLLLRRPARRLFGAELAYALWLAPPAAMLGAMLTASDDVAPIGAASALDQAARVWLSRPDHAVGVFALWLLGVTAAASFVTWSQLRFMAAARVGRAGPAVTGIIHARLVTPADFAERFTPEERALVRAHERAHIDRLDARANALTVLVQCLGWFNPVLHMGSHAMRLDQELACDAAVVARLPRERRRYAETLLRIGLVQQGAAPLTCHWASRRAHPLEARIALLARPAPSQARHDAGVALLAMLAIGAVYAAWAAEPPQPPWLALVVTLPFTVMFDMA